MQKNTIRLEPMQKVLQGKIKSYKDSKFLMYDTLMLKCTKTEYPEVYIRY